MKKITLMIVCLLGYMSYGQVNINENFDSGTPTDWTGTYSNTAESACAGNSERDNIYATDATGNLTSPNIVMGSNGTDLNISFDYVILDYPSGFDPPSDATPVGWGSAELQYSTDDGANWTTILTIDDSNHVVSATCATIMATVPAASLPDMSDVKLQILNTWAAGDYYFYVDNFVAQQDLGCTQPVGTAVFNSEDCMAGTFDILVDVTDLGDGSPALFDGTTTFPIAATGSFLVGPYTLGTPVVLTLQHGANATCDVALGSIEDTGTCPVFATVDCSAGTPVNTTVCYDSNEDLRYSFTSNDGSPLRVDFVEGYFEDCCDDIIIYDGGAITDTVLFQSDGSENDDATGISAIASGDTILVQIVSDGSVSCAAGSGSGIPLNFNVSCSSCAPAVIDTVTIVDSCNPDGTGTFTLDIVVSDAGDAGSVFDDGTTTYPVVAGTVTAGPYNSGESIVIELVATDPACSSTVGTYEYTCPQPPPANDDCANATVAASLPYTNTQLDAAAATNNDGFIDPENGSCGTNGMNDGVWYTFTPSTTGVVDVSITNVSGWDPEVAIYSGSCGTFTCEGRADSAGSGGSETLSAIAVTSGVQYWINVGYYSDLTNSSEGPFQIDISDVTLGLDNVDSPAAFTYYPNPVKNTLNLNAQNTIEQVAMYNMLGQEVLRATPNAIDSELDMSSLQTGTYFVKVTIANVTKTIRVIKQ